MVIYIYVFNMHFSIYKIDFCPFILLLNGVLNVSLQKFLIKKLSTECKVNFV